MKEVLQRTVRSMMGDRPSIELSTGELFGIINNYRRRRVIRCVASKHAAGQTVVPLNELAEELAADAADPDKEYKRLYVTILQVHAPKLDESRVVDYDDDLQTLRATERCLAIATLLEEIELRCAGGYNEPVLEVHQR